MLGSAMLEVLLSLVLVYLELSSISSASVELLEMFLRNRAPSSRG
jgi:hypothetical protein